VVETKCDISETSKDFRYWSTIGGLSEGTRANVLRADIVVVPSDGFRDYPGPLFPSGTAELFHYLKGNLPSGSEAELAVEDQDFRELSLHADILTIATCVVKYAAIPLLVKLLGDWIAKRLGSRANVSEVRASLVVVQADGAQSKNIQISYEGPAATFEATVKSALDKVPSCGPSVASALERSDTSGNAPVTNA
jgi:hypothetical protein